MRTGFLLLLSIALWAGPAHGEWTTLAPGLDFGTFETVRKRYVGSPSIMVIRIDPEQWDLEVVGKSWPGEAEAMTAKRWCEKHGFTAAINAGMFGQDLRTHLGYLRGGGHVNNAHINGYRSVAAFDPKENRDVPPFRIFDLDAPGIEMKRILRDYGSVVQNLRLIKRPGKNRWAEDSKSWNEAALGEDEAGRALFIYTETPFAMHEFNDELLNLGIGVVAAQHLEGGPVAQLYLRVGEVELDWVGGYPGAIGNPLRLGDMPIPHVIGIRPKKAERGD